MINNHTIMLNYNKPCFITNAVDLFRGFRTTYRISNFVGLGKTGKRLFRWIQSNQSLNLSKKYFSNASGKKSLYIYIKMLDKQEFTHVPTNSMPADTLTNIILDCRIISESRILFLKVFLRWFLNCQKLHLSIKNQNPLTKKQWNKTVSRFKELHKGFIKSTSILVMLFYSFCHPSSFIISLIIFR